jgi:DNA-binding MarR family transcriptional regulator
METRNPDLITTTAARILLGISTKKMAELIKNGTLETHPNPLDRRVKYVSRKAVKALQTYKAAA